MGIPYNIRGIEIQCKCLNPEHQDNNPSFSINSLTGFYNCFSCGHKGNFKTYLEGVLDEDMERTALYLESLRALEDTGGTPEGPVGDPSDLLPPRSHIEVPPFRGLSKETIDANDLYYCNVGRYKGRIIFPMDYGFDARIYPLDETAPTAQQAKYLRPRSFKTAKHMFICKAKEYSDTVIICEGVLDALSFAELGYNAAANFGLLPCSPDKAGELFAEGFTSVVNGFDSDAAGIAGWQKVKDSFREYFTILPPLDIIKKLNASKTGDINDYLISLKED